LGGGFDTVIDRGLTLLSFLHAAFWPSGDHAFSQVLLFELELPCYHYKLINTDHNNNKYRSSFVRLSVSLYHPFLYYQYNHKFIFQFLSEFKWNQIGYIFKDVNRSHFQVMTRIPDEINVF